MPTMELFVVIEPGVAPALVWRGGETSRSAELRQAEIVAGLEIKGTRVDASAIRDQLAEARHGAIAVAETRYESGKGTVAQRLISLTNPAAPVDFATTLRTLVGAGEHSSAHALAREHAGEVAHDRELRLLSITAAQGAGLHAEAANEALALIGDLGDERELAIRLWQVFAPPRKGDVPRRWPPELGVAAASWWATHGGQDIRAFPRENIGEDDWPRAFLLAVIRDLLAHRDPDRLVDEAPRLLDRMRRAGEDADADALREQYQKLRDRVDRDLASVNAWQTDVWPGGSPRVLDARELADAWARLEVPCVTFDEAHLAGLALPDEAVAILRGGALPAKGRSVSTTAAIASCRFRKPKQRRPLVDVCGDPDHELHHVAGGRYEGALFEIGAIDDGAVEGRLMVDRRGALVSEIEDGVAPLAGSLAPAATILLAAKRFHARAREVYKRAPIPEVTHRAFAQVAQRLDPEAGALIDMIL